MRSCGCSSRRSKIVNTLSVERRDDLLTRLDRVRVTSDKLGYGVGADLQGIWLLPSSLVVISSSSSRGCGKSGIPRVVRDARVLVFSGSNLGLGDSYIPCLPSSEQPLAIASSRG